MKKMNIRNPMTPAPESSPLYANSSVETSPLATGKIMFRASFIPL